MKSYRNLWPEVTSLENLFLAARQARKGKRTKNACAAFEFHLEREVFDLHRALVEGTYSFGPYTTFEIREPKPRTISAAPTAPESSTMPLSRFSSRGRTVPSSTIPTPAGPAREPMRR